MFSEGVHIIAERGGNLSMSSVSDAARVECWSVCCLGAVVAAFIPRALWLTSPLTSHLSYHGESPNLAQHIVWLTALFPTVLP
mmetsp:Transcript_26112/g.49035  ORF Transcript_26112/g.49035 Transcript_26112/m.49035 type:complete len:83 (+) Transcript_26112:409-657(+)